MEPLSILLWIKIIGTLIPVGLPLIFLSKQRIEAVSGFTSSDVIVYRLYGMAIIALLVGYYGGYVQVTNGVFPAGVIWMGLMSNAGAATILILTGRARKAPWEAAFFGLIAAGLVASLAQPEFVMKSLW